MGCEKEVHPEKPETGQSPVLSSRGTECKTEGDNHNSGILYDVFKPVTYHSGNKPVNQKNFKMASYNNTSDLNNCDQSNVREPVESIDETLGELVESDNKSEQSTDENVSHLNHESAEIDNKETKVPNHNSGDTDNTSEVANITVPENTVTETVNATVEMNIRADDEMQTSNEHAPSASLPVEVIVKTSSEDTATSSGSLSNENIQLELLHRLEQLKDRLDTCTDIPPILLDVSLDCLKPSTIEYMSFHLDPESDVLSPGEKCKDYRGMAEWIGLENIFIKYISRSPYMLKTREVLSKWLTLEEEPLPTLKNLRKCLLDIDRPDVLEDMSIKMARDAVSWKMTKFEAQTKKPRNEDKSWQLTRHDVVTGKETYYTCCLVYADEDEGMAQIFIKLYKSVYPKALFFLPQFDLKQGKFLYETTAQVIEERCEGKVIFIISEYFFASSVCRFTVQFCKDMKDLVSGKKTMYTACLLYADEDELMAQLITKLYKTAYKDSLFFLPQFDLKHGKYELDTTARVIDERCDKKVVFLLSEYFYASHICQFAVNYAAAHGTGHGNLIPFHLTRNVNSVPNVLKGIAGIRWFRKATRQHTWQILSDSLLAEKLDDRERLADIKEKIRKMVEKDKEYYLQDPPYDDDVEPPGEPIEVIEPEGSSSMPSSMDIEFQRLKIEEELQRTREKEKMSKWKIVRQIKRAIFEKLLPKTYHPKGKSSSPSSSPPMTELNTFKVCDVSGVNVSDSKTVNSANNPTESMKNGDRNGDGSELGAVGGEDISPECNDLNIDSDSRGTDKSKVMMNIAESESMVMNTMVDSLRENNQSACSRHPLEELSGYGTNSKTVSNTVSKSKLKNCTGINGEDKKQRNCSRKNTSSYEEKPMQTEESDAERETLICKEGDVTRDISDLHADSKRNSVETDALMSDYSQA